MMFLVWNSPAVPMPSSYYNSCLESIDISPKSKKLVMFTELSKKTASYLLSEKKGGRSNSLTKIVLVIKDKHSDEESRSLTLPNIKIQ